MTALHDRARESQGATNFYSFYVGEGFECSDVLRIGGATLHSILSHLQGTLERDER